MSRYSASLSKLAQEVSDGVSRQMLKHVKQDDDVEACITDIAQIRQRVGAVKARCLRTRDQQVIRFDPLHR